MRIRSVASSAALYLSAFRPIQILRQQARSGPAGGAFLRQTLVILQYTATIVLLIGTAVVVRQLGFIQDKALGFDEENVVAVYLNHGEAREHYGRFKQTFLQHPRALR